MGLHDDKSNEIIRRKSFKEKKSENIWNINDANIIRTFLHWVCQTFALPITDKVQVSILEPLFSALRISGVYSPDDFVVAKEWTNELYLEWKKNKQTKIFIIDGNLPYRGIFEKSIFTVDLLANILISAILIQFIFHPTENLPPYCQMYIQIQESRMCSQKMIGIKYS